MPAAYLTSAAAMEDLKRLNARFIQNFVTNDVAAHDALLHPDFLYIRANGQRVDRATYLKNWATGFDPDVIRYWDVRDEVITLVGPVALVRSANKCIALVNGREETSMTVYTDVYLHDRGRWWCLQAQITPLARGCEPADDTIISVYLRGILQTGGP